MTCKDCKYRGVDSHNCPVCCCVGKPPDDCWKTIRPLTPYIGLDGKHVVCSDEECYCGDARESHVGGTGKCMICQWSPIMPKEHCQEFKKTV